MASALGRLGDSKPPVSTTTLKLNIGFKGLGVGGERVRCEEGIPQIPVGADLNNIISALLDASGARPNENAVVVVDEFDRINSDEERAQFADFIKQVGDQRIPIRFVFCGVAESMQKLLGAHDSCYRYLDGIELKTLNYEARIEIIDNVANALGVRVEERQRYRIAAISDGFPHFIHRMCEQLFWQMFDDPQPCETPTADHYREAVVGSVRCIEQHLRQTYDQAVMKNAPDYEQVLWAFADHSDMIRNTEGIYSSYLSIMNNLDNDVEILDRSTIVTRLNALKSQRCGHILATQRRGWYRFNESMMRGYVRLRAEEQDVELALDYAAAGSNSSLSGRLRAARKSKRGSTPARWRKTQYFD
jgi:hypothetical protein